MCQNTALLGRTDYADGGLLSGADGTWANLRPLLVLRWAIRPPNNVACPTCPRKGSISFFFAFCSFAVFFGLAGGMIFWHARRKARKFSTFRSRGAVAAGRGHCAVVYAPGQSAGVNGLHAAWAVVASWPRRRSTNLGPLAES